MIDRIAIYAKQMKENLERYLVKQRLMKVILAENGNEGLEESSRNARVHLLENINGGMGNHLLQLKLSFESFTIKL